MQRSTVFKSNKSQAIRLPKAVALPPSVKQVDIVKIGSARLITPAGESWDSWFDGPPATADFSVDANRGLEQSRDDI